MLPRYNFIFESCRKYKPTSICEIGTNRGKTAVRILKVAHEMSPLSVISYTGYDLFEMITPEISEAEGNGKSQELNMEDIKLFLSKKMKKAGIEACKIKLIKGDTNEVLRKRYYDFVFLDGGHSISTIRNDYEKIAKSKVIIFDDYYADRHGEHTLERVSKGFGCNELIDDLSKRKDLVVEFYPKLGTKDSPLEKDDNIHLVLIVRKKDWIGE